ncbi:MAG: hypothetical protein H0X68_05470 [Chloroflexi bacterium]|nr:hypothetical protein [Chloroflexota bacterium]
MNAAENRGAQPAGRSLPDTAMGLPGADPIGGLLLIGLAGPAVWRRLVATVR